MSKLAHSIDITARAIALNETVRGKVVTHFEYPPIPLRKFDWCAYRDGAEENSPRGWGATEDDAIADLLQLEAE